MASNHALVIIVVWRRMMGASPSDVVCASAGMTAGMMTSMAELPVSKLNGAAAGRPCHITNAASEQIATFRVGRSLSMTSLLQMRLQDRTVWSNAEIAKKRTSDFAGVATNPSILLC